MYCVRCGSRERGSLLLTGLDWSSHWHWDHTGDPSTFPDTTDLVVGPGFKANMMPGYPEKERGLILESDYKSVVPLTAFCTSGYVGDAERNFVAEVGISER